MMPHKMTNRDLAEILRQFCEHDNSLPQFLKMLIVEAARRIEQLDKQEDDGK